MTPFGFGPSPSDEGPENFDFNEMMRRMQSEFQKIAPGFANPAMFAPSQGALPKDVIREVAKSFIQTHGTQPVGANDQAKCEEAFGIANTWLDQSTLFPAVTYDHPAISPLDWLNITIEGWHSTFEPLAIGLTDAVSKLIGSGWVRFLSFLIKLINLFLLNLVPIANLFDLSICSDSLAILSKLSYS